MAIRADLRLSDKTIECEYQTPIHNGQTEMIFGAQDNAHHYYAYIPNWGQLHRARAFRACTGVAQGAGLEMHVSADGGADWDAGTMIDRPTYFNGATLEVEPDVLLVVYPESQIEILPPRVRAQRVRITSDGPVSCEP